MDPPQKQKPLCMVAGCLTPRRKGGLCYRHRHTPKECLPPLAHLSQTQKEKLTKEANAAIADIVNGVVMSAVVRSEASAIWQEGYPSTAYVVDSARPDYSQYVHYLGVVKYALHENCVRRVRRLCNMRGCSKVACRVAVGHKCLMEVRQKKAKPLSNHRWVEAACSRHWPLFANRGGADSDLHWLSIEHYVDAPVFDYLVANGYARKEDCERGEQGSLIRAEP